jgi:hypothetical protein
MIFVRQLLRTIGGVMHYLFKPSEKIVVVPKIKESMASIHWLFNSHAPR